MSVCLSQILSQHFICPRFSCTDWQKWLEYHYALLLGHHTSRVFLSSSMSLKKKNPLLLCLIRETLPYLIVSILSVFMRISLCQYIVKYLEISCYRKPQITRPDCTNMENRFMGNFLLKLIKTWFSNSLYCQAQPQLQLQG